MASAAAAKRPLPPSIARMKARKRQKLGLDEKETKREKTKLAPRISNAGKIVRASDLQWAEVIPPDQLDYYEGFYGLEEVEGVDVVRDEETGLTSFKLKESTKAESKSSQKASKTDRATKNFSGDHDDAIDAQEVEWTGLDDEDEAGKVTKSKVVPEDEAARKSIKKEEPKKKKKEKKLQKQKQQQQHQTGDVSSTGFDMLPEHAEDDDGEVDVDMSQWQSLNLSPYLTAALAGLKFSSPTAIQSKAIPVILEGHDIIGKAPTGSGKTLAFGIPMLQEILATRTSAAATKTGVKIPTGLIILPTRELAHQIADHLNALCSKSSFESPSIATLTGGLSIQKQRRQLANADIIIATPGRLWEVVSEGHGVLSALKQIKFLVIDEADRLLTEGHFKELEQLLIALDRKVTKESEDGSEQIEQATVETYRQTLVFSATFSKELQQRLRRRTYSSSEQQSSQASMEYLLKKLSFREERPVFVDVNPVSQMAENLQEALLECPGAEKDVYLYCLLMLYQERRLNRALVFVNSISAVRRIVPFLNNLNLTAHALHSQMPQKARLRSIERFSADADAGSSSSSILVATDVAARGLDIPNVQLVVHYHVPRAADTYVHRSGRTARADKSGTSVLICAPAEAAGVRRLVAQIHHGRHTQATQAGYSLRSLHLDVRIVSGLRPRASLAKQLADAALAKEKKSSEDAWIQRAAEDLGVEIDDEFGLELGGKKGGGKGRAGSGRKKREAEARATTRAETAVLRAQLRDLLSRRVNLGVSETYITKTPGAIDLDALLQQRASTGDGAATAGLGTGAFLGVAGLD